MNIKKLLLVVLSLGVGICSCTESHLDDSRESSVPDNGRLIRFSHRVIDQSISRSVLQPLEVLYPGGDMISVDVLPLESRLSTMTRGSFVNQNTIPNMGILASLLHNTSFSVDALTGHTPNFMYNQTMTYNGANWVSDPPFFWPEVTGDSLTFFGYSPRSSASNGLSISTNQQKGIPYVDYVMPTLASNQPDLLVANPLFNRVMSQGGVNMGLNHALSGVGFTLRGDNNHVKSIGLTGLSVGGRLVMDGRAISWSNLSTPTTEVYDAGINYDEGLQYTLATAVKKEEPILMKTDGYLMVIPQTLTANTKIVIILEDNTRKELAINVATPSWTAGNKYVYNIVIQPDNIIIDETSTSNCYNFNSSATRGVIYKFPAVTRVNEFWATAPNGGYNGADGDGYVALGNVETNAILDDVTEWYGYVIWADFADFNKVTIKQKNEAGSYGVGRNEKMEITFPKGNYSGNIVIGLKKKGGGNCLWSWHFWINPEGTVVQDVTLPDGTVVMDRNLGATTTTAGEVGNLGLQYQWGRKDAFLGSSSVSTTTQRNPTTGSFANSAANAGTLLLSVYNPTTRYLASSTGTRDCINTGHLSGANGYNRWGATTANNDATPLSNNKTIFDPCPVGYRIPTTDVNRNFSGLTTTNTTWSATNYGITYTAGNNFFPAAGYFNYTTGALTSVGSQGQYWSGASSLVSTYYVGHSLWFFPTSVQTARAVIRSGSGSVRPAK